MKVERKAARRTRSAEKPDFGGSGQQVAARTGAPGPAAAVRYVTVDQEYEGQRLDNFLIRIAKGVPKSHIYRIVRSGEVRVNRGRVAADHRVAAGDRIRIPPLRTTAHADSAPPTAMLPVVFEDEHLLVVDKPADVAAHGGSGVSFGVIERVRAARPNQPFLELVHRLDRATSGLLMLAKSRRALVELHQLIRQGDVDKHYLVLVAGDWVNDRQHVRLALSRIGGGDGAVKVRVDAQDGVVAHTVFELRERLGEFALLDAELRTGRTHQIRVHLSAIGHPVVGDQPYSQGRSLPGATVTRPFLHAYALAFDHPATNERMSWTSELPDDLAEQLAALGE